MDNIERFISYINESSKIVFFGGAGVSTESGIPDFRSKDGLYNQPDVRFEKYSPEYLLSRECLYNTPKVFYEFYRQKMDTRDIEPNITHKTLAFLESIGKVSAVVTQNIDGLHQKAGSKNVYEIHGTTRRNYCGYCLKFFAEDYIFESEDNIPKCKYCGHQVRPAVTLYGENLPVKQVSDAIKAIEEADMLIIGGTSLSVYPACEFVDYFRGKHKVIINKEELNIGISEENDIVFTDELGNIFNEVLNHYIEAGMCNDLS